MAEQPKKQDVEKAIIEECNSLIESPSTVRKGLTKLVEKGIIDDFTRTGLISTAERLEKAKYNKEKTEIWHGLQSEIESRFSYMIGQLTHGTLEEAQQKESELTAKDYLRTTVTTGKTKINEHYNIQERER